MALVTFAVRYPLLGFLGRISMPEIVRRALRYVPPAVLTAIILPAVLAPEGFRILLGPGNAHLAAGIAALLIAWRYKHLLATIIGGMLVFWAWRLLLGALPL
jgi:branched-subunit amino acid transport protein